MPLRRRRLGGVEWIVVRSHRAARAEKRHRLRPGDVSIVGYLLGGGVRRAAVGNEHDEAIDADGRHRPIVEKLQPILARHSPGQMLPSALSCLVAVSAAVI